MTVARFLGIYGGTLLTFLALDAVLRGLPRSQSPGT